jgi:predicted nucleotidyltransferase
MSNIPVLMDLLFSGARQRVLAVLLLQPTDSFHLRELARLTHSHPGTLARELEKLAEGGLVSRSELGNQVRYQADTKCPLFSELAAIFRKTHGAAALLREALQPLDEKIRLALVFGSIARGTASPGSDVDLLVVGDVGFSELVQALFPTQQLLGREINPALYSQEDFRLRAGQGDAFLRDIASKPMVFLKGDKHDLAELVGNGAIAAANS